MAVALKRQEFEGTDFYESGALSFAFADKSGFARNEPAYGSPKLVHGANAPKADEDGRILDTDERLEHFYVNQEPLSFGHKTDLTNIGYSVQILDMTPMGIKGSEPENNQGVFSTSAGRMQVFINPDAQAIREENKQKKDADFQQLLHIIQDNNDYIKELTARIAEIDQKLEGIRQRREELLQDELLAGDLGGSSNEERRANKRRVAGRLGIETNRFTDANSNIDYNAMDRAIKEELALQREQLAREERELREQRDAYQTELKEHQKKQSNKDPEALKAEADDRKAMIQEVRNGNTSITDTQAQKAADLDLDSLFSIGVKKPEASASNNTHQFSTAPRSTSSFAEGVDLLSNGANSSFSSIQLTSQFVKASDPKDESTQPENTLHLGNLHAKQTLQMSAYRL